MKTILQEDEAFPAAVKEIRGIPNLGNLPLVVIASDRASDEPGEGRAIHAQQQRDLTKLSRDSQLVVAENSGHDVPLSRPDVVVQALANLIKPREQPDSRGTP